MTVPARADDLRDMKAANRIYLDRVLGTTRMRVALGAPAPLLERVVERYARQSIQFDEDIARLGMQAAARRWVSLFTRDFEVRGAEHVPAQGPVVFAANHPGSYDMEASLAAIPRADVMTMVADVPFYRIMRNYAQGRFIYVGDDAGQRREAAALSAQHVKAGRALLINPAGNIELEPGFAATAEGRLGEWHRSLELLARWAPDLVVIPTAVSGVLHPAANNRALRRVLGVGSIKERESLAVAMRLFLPLLKTARVEVRFGAPLRPTDRGTGTLTDRVRAALLAVLPGDGAAGRPEETTWPT